VPSALLTAFDYRPERSDTRSEGGAATETEKNQRSANADTSAWT
jgi:hypothetical protein